MKRHTESDDEVDSGVGDRLLAARKSLGISQRELARQSGTTHTTISQIELGRTSPTLSSLMKILEALEISLSDFFATEEESHDARAFFRREDLQVLIEGHGVEILQVGSDAQNQELQMLFAVHSAGGDTGGEMIVHDGEEVGVVVKGEFEVTLGDQVQVLRAGDAFRFSSLIPHRFRNISDGESWVVRGSTTPAGLIPKK